MIWRSTIQQEGHEFVRYIINKFSDSFKSVDVGIYFDDYVYVVKTAFCPRAPWILIRRTTR